MGGWGSGGHNRTHRTVEDYRKIDSFNFRDYLNGDKYLQYKDNVKYPVHGGDIVYHVKTKSARIRQKDGYRALALSRVPNIDGTTYRMYFHCPECGKRVRYLYNVRGVYSCRRCSNLNYKSQQKSGMEELRLKMERIVENELEYCWWRNDYDCVADLYFIPKPRYMRIAKYERLISEFRALQKEYERVMHQYIHSSEKFLLKYYS